MFKNWGVLLEQNPSLCSAVILKRPMVPFTQGYIHVSPSSFTLLPLKNILTLMGAFSKTALNYNSKWTPNTAVKRFPAQRRLIKMSEWFIFAQHKQIKLILLTPSNCSKQAMGLKERFKLNYLHFWPQTLKVLIVYHCHSSLMWVFKV